MESGFDNLYVYEFNEDGLLNFLAILNGYDLPSSIVSSANQLSLTFVSDATVTEQGFEANFYTGWYINQFTI